MTTEEKKSIPSYVVFIIALTMLFITAAQAFSQNYKREGNNFSKEITLVQNIALQRINNDRFTIKLCTIAHYLNIKTVGKMKKYCLEHERVGGNIPYFRGRLTIRLLKEIEQYENNLQCIPSL